MRKGDGEGFRMGWEAWGGRLPDKSSISTCSAFNFTVNVSFSDAGVIPELFALAMVSAIAAWVAAAKEERAEM